MKKSISKTEKRNNRLANKSLKARIAHSAMSGIVQSPIPGGLPSLRFIDAWAIMTQDSFWTAMASGKVQCQGEVKRLLNEVREFDRNYPIGWSGYYSWSEDKWGAWETYIKERENVL